MSFLGNDLYKFQPGILVVENKIGKAIGWHRLKLKEL